MESKRIVTSTLGVAVTLFYAASTIDATEITLRLHNPEGLSAPSYPFTVGVSRPVECHWWCPIGVIGFFFRR